LDYVIMRVRTFSDTREVTSYVCTFLDTLLVVRHHSTRASEIGAATRLNALDRVRASKEAARAQ
jgi:hypothetical protein